MKGNLFKNHFLILLWKDRRPNTMHNIYQNHLACSWFTIQTFAQALIIQYYYFNLLLSIVRLNWFQTCNYLSDMTLIFFLFLVCLENCPPIIANKPRNSVFQKLICLWFFLSSLVLSDVDIDIWEVTFHLTTSQSFFI